MSKTTLGINPTTEGTGSHDPAAVLFSDGVPVYGVEEERLNRDKRAFNTFPKRSIQSCLDYADIYISNIDNVLISWEPEAMAKHDAKLAFKQSSPRRGLYQIVESAKNYSTGLSRIRNKLSQFGTPVPPIETYNHHRCHAASAFYPSGFEEAIVLTLDGRGESDATVVWKGDSEELERLKTFAFPNSLGAFYAHITEFLGFRMNNDEGKVMGLAPYGKPNEEIRAKLQEVVRADADYDVNVGFHDGTTMARLKELFDRPPKSSPPNGPPTGFTQWEKDFAYESQALLERIVENIVTEHCTDLGIANVCLAGGVALNCKMNKRVMELDVVDGIFVQPVAHDGGGALGAGLLDTESGRTDEPFHVYLGPRYTTSDIKKTLEEIKLDHEEPDELEPIVARKLANGALVGWFQSRLEMGPRALGNRSILADPRTVESRDRVNKFVKHREEWRPFAPSLLERAADEYFVNAEPAPYMIKTFDVKEAARDEIPAVLHPADDTARPQTVNETQNPRYHRLLREFEKVTGVPVLLNTSFNDSGEPIVNTPAEAIKDFFGMGLDVLVIEDILLEKSAVTSGKPNREDGMSESYRPPKQQVDSKAEQE